MSEEKRWPLAESRAVAETLLRALLPYCEPGYLEIAGSIRREKPTVGDIEICFVSRSEVKPDPNDMFGSVAVYLVDRALAELERDGILEKRLGAAGRVSYGRLIKLMRHVPTGIPVDFFGEPKKEDWIRTLIIRTGSREHNIALIGNAKKVGINVHAFHDSLTWIGNGDTVPAPQTEREFFALCSTPWKDPKAR